MILNMKVINDFFRQAYARHLEEFETAYSERRAAVDKALSGRGRKNRSRKRPKSLKSKRKTPSK